MARYIEVKADNARRFAVEVLDLAPSLHDVSDSGLFVYQAHMTLASLARLGEILPRPPSRSETLPWRLRRGLAYGGRVAA